MIVAGYLEAWRKVTNGGRPMRDAAAVALRVQWERAYETAEQRRRAERLARKAEAAPS